MDKRKTLDHYLEIIRIVFINAEEGRSQILTILEKAIMDISFDGKIARELRLRENITAKDLGLKLGFGGEMMILNYETGRKNPSADTDRGKAYLEWLKERGYNPLEGTIPKTLD